MSKFVAKAARAHEEEAAAMDVHECVCIDAMIAKWHAEDPDETLFLVLALCYIARLSDAERSACAATLGWDGARAQMDCMVDFARRVLLSRTPTLDSLEASRQDEEVTEHLERLWSAFCRERNMKVCSKEVARTDIDMDFFPAEPYRKPCNGEFRWRCKGDVEEKWDIKFSPLSTTFAGEVPKLLDLVSKVVNSDFFFFHPVDNMDIESRRLGRLSKWTASCLHPCGSRNWYCCSKGSTTTSSCDRSPSRGHRCPCCRTTMPSRFARSTLASGLGATTSESITTTKLYMFKCFVGLDGRLGTQDSSTQEEEEVLANGFYKERTPSFMEKAVRICTMGEMWVSSSEKEEAWLMNMWPEDYDLAKPPDTAMWRAYRQYVGHPVVVPKEQSKIGAARVLSDIDYEYTRYLGWETKSKHSEDGLFPLPVPTLHEIL
ncbi:hypothetical protein SELMODRAFT_415614 [Selaginella moellendorffii]|uniref:Uncharacterized protein n=1 Tax=Selaginella moellendorffii TaxID=88036 RepID=D8RWP6_SELML|nr:hypothetical protein SELMODRAFT_415614 [Selaginella moellendorffii]